MRHPILFFLSFLLLSCGNSQKIAREYLNQDIPLVYNVTVKFKFIPAYCGGAAPSQEMEEERRKGVPYRSEVLYMDKNGDPNYESFVTDQFGALRLALLKGNYCIKKPYKIEKSKLAKFKADGWEFDSDCLTKELERCDFSFVVTKDTIIEYEIYGRCHYNGPVPCVSNPGIPPP